ncbi:hypothetical protein SAMN02910293_00062 [Streptococcus henryi]|uniref:Uncharacterized protein n=1 Tax=Streptococcus henryi TaxID=439219 RepID=A0A1G5ZZU5_9STRE|nr:hypothetical protein SAMN02910293_00062 [Streptococcus henryi]
MLIINIVKGIFLLTFNIIKYLVTLYFRFLREYPIETIVITILIIVFG